MNDRLKIAYDLGVCAKKYIKRKYTNSELKGSERVRFWDGYYDQMLFEDLPKSFGKPDYNQYRDKEVVLDKG